MAHSLPSCREVRGKERKGRWPPACSAPHNAAQPIALLSSLHPLAFHTPAQPRTCSVPCSGSAPGGGPTTVALWPQVAVTAHCTVPSPRLPPSPLPHPRTYIVFSLWKPCRFCSPCGPTDLPLVLFPLRLHPIPPFVPDLDPISKPLLPTGAYPLLRREAGTVTPLPLLTLLWCSPGHPPGPWDC